MMMNNPAIQIGDNKVYSGHNLDVLKTLADNSVDSIVTDPPYELGFMSKSWDSTGIAYSVELWQECLRVLKPGGHLLAFGGSRTWHRLAVAIEDAGFEMRDSIAWLYGSGFPKSHNISKAIDKAAGAEREIVGSKVTRIPGGNTYAQDEWTLKAREMGKVDITEPATDDAKKWDGWGTALKPAFEPIVVARKPLIGTVAENVLQFATGGLNIDASRIGTGTGEKKIVHYPDIPGNNYGQDNETYAERPTVEREVIDQGRWPANVILDETTAKLLDEQSGVSKSTPSLGHTRKGNQVGDERTSKAAGMYGDGAWISGSQHNDSGGASRFFYVAKASKRDRNEGLDELPEQIVTGRDAGQDARQVPYKTRSNPVKNIHPTVKPTQLMKYLIKLVTPEAGVVLDPFAGSGSTGKAAILEGYTFIGIELTEDYLPIIKGRLQHAYQTYTDKGDDLFA